MNTLLANIWATVSTDATLLATVGGANRILKSWPSTLPELTAALPAWIVIAHRTTGGEPTRMHGAEQSVELTFHTFALHEMTVETVHRRLSILLDGKPFRGAGAWCGSANEGPSGIVQDPVRGAKHGFVMYTLLNVGRIV